MRFFVIALLIVAPLGQRPTPLVLGPPLAALDEEFTVITSVRELRDGRVLVTDPREPRLVVADFGTGQVETISRRGRGPGEYEMLAILRRLGGDSTLIPDMISRRWLMLDGARVVRTLPPDAPIILATHGSASHVDTVGHILSQLRPSKVGVEEITVRDSTALVLLSRQTARAETIAYVRERPRRIEREVNAQGRTIRGSSRPTAPGATEEAGVLFMDGWVAVARLDPFRIDWRSPSGQWMYGRPLPVRSRRLTAAERADLARRQRAAGGLTEAPRVLPPYVSRFSLRAASDGSLLIERPKVGERDSTRYLVVARAGLRGELSLPPHERIIGFGQRSVFVVTADADGIERLRRHAWP